MKRFWEDLLMDEYLFLKDLDPEKILTNLTEAEENEIDYYTQLADETEEFEEYMVKEAQGQIREIPALLWLAYEMKVTPDKLGAVLEMVRNNLYPYRMITLKKRDGGKRTILIPADPLKLIQRKIIRYILSSFQTGPNCYGFSGGSIQKAIEPHLGAKVILCVDIKGAFSSVDSNRIMHYLNEERTITYGHDFLGRRFSYRVGEYGRMSWYAARIIVDLTTYPVIGSAKVLPQGAPTSPWLFDLLCKRLDDELSIFAGKVRGNYTRYADNIFFSMDQDEFPRPVKNAVLRMIRTYGRFNLHKIRVRRMTQGAVRLLGLNMLEGKVHNTRDFKRRLRLAIHHVEWFLDNGLQDTPDFETAWQKLQGQMAFVRIDTLPTKLLDSFVALEERIEAQDESQK